MRIDLHCHTHHSRDGLITFDALLRQMDRRALDMLAITDHNTVAGALAFHNRAPGRFIVGEEIKTTEGELIALFLKNEVSPGLSPRETIDRVRAQGGIVGASHPLDRMRAEAMGRETLELLHQELDFIEVFNARTIHPEDNRLAQEMALSWDLPGSAGSDAHTLFEVGRAYVAMPSFAGPETFLQSLGKGQIAGRLSCPLVHLVSTYAKWRSQFRTN